MEEVIFAVEGAKEEFRNDNLQSSDLRVLQNPIPK
jgi:hypothetical protein